MDILLEVMGDVLGTSPGAVRQALIDGDGEDAKLKSDDTVKTWITNAFQDKFKKIESKAHDEGHGRGKRETLTSLEKSLAEKFEVEKGSVEEMFESYAAKKAGNKSKDITPDDVKASEFFKKTVTDLKAETQKVQTEFDDYKAKTTRSDTAAVVRSKVIDMLNKEDNKFILPASETVQKSLTDSVISRLMGENLNVIKSDTGEVDEIVVLGEDGKTVKQDDKFNPIKFDALAMSTLKQFYEVGQTNPRHRMPGNTQSRSKDPKTFSFGQPKSREEAFRHLRSIRDPEESRAYNEYIKELTEAGTIK